MANGVNRSEKLLSQVELGLSMGTENDETSSPTNKSELQQKTFCGLTHRQTTLGIAVMEVVIKKYIIFTRITKLFINVFYAVIIIMLCRTISLLGSKLSTSCKTNTSSLSSRMFDR